LARAVDELVVDQAVLAQVRSVLSGVERREATSTSTGSA
jgi:hypothetical protein